MSEIFTAAIIAIHAFVIGVDFIGAIAIVTNRFHVVGLRWWQCLYLFIVFAKSLSFLLIDSCPLTIGENYCRRLGRVDNSYDGSFVSHYLPRISTEVDSVFTCLLMLAGFVAVLRVGHHQMASLLATPNLGPLPPKDQT